MERAFNKTKKKQKSNRAHISFCTFKQSKLDTAMSFCHEIKIKLNSTFDYKL